jgi:hypothetical protein
MVGPIRNHVAADDLVREAPATFLAELLALEVLDLRPYIFDAHHMNLFLLRQLPASYGPRVRIRLAPLAERRAGVRIVQRMGNGKRLRHDLQAVRCEIPC